jgi:malate dehydrogenase (oxaloacetate-decarboxylating)
MDVYEESLKLHEEHKGKLSVTSKVPLKTKKDLTLVYTPGVAEPSRKIAINKEDAYKYTGKGNMVAVISNGTAVLGLGDIGAYGAIPVMEGKALLFKELAEIDAFPICIESKNVEENIQIIKNIIPVFGGINLEDYKAPECFEIESRLQNLGIPVMHDDQHGTAIVVLAGLMNALKVAGKKLNEVKIVVNGAGAAAIAVTKLLINAIGSGKNIIMCDTKGQIYSGRVDLKDNKFKEEISKITNPEKKQGTLFDALTEADVFIGLSKGNLLNSENIKKMASNSIIFAMANPIPEILPEEALKGGALIVASGRSDFPNQVNNALAFPGIFRGALDCRATRITEKMKLSAAKALSEIITDPSKNKILPDVLDKQVAIKVSEAVKKAWIKENKI